MTRQDRFAALVVKFEAEGLHFGGREVDYQGGRYVVFSGDRGCDMADFAEAESLDGLAEAIGFLLECSFAYIGWYDLDEEDVHPHGCSWTVSIVHGADEGSMAGDCYV